MTSKRILLIIGWIGALLLCLAGIPAAIFAAILLVGVVPATYREIRAARRMLPAENLGTLASPVLLLRSFEHDATAVREPIAGLGSLVPFYNFYLLSRGPGAIDQLLFREIEMRLGDLVALSDCSRFSPPVGARCVDTSGADWQRLALDLMKKARAILVVAGATEGLRAEIELLRTAVDPRKIFLIAPYAVQWHHVRRAFGAVGWVVPAEDPGRHAVIGFDEEFAPHVLTTTASSAPEIVTAIDRWLRGRPAIPAAPAVVPEEAALMAHEQRADPDSFATWLRSVIKEPFAAGVVFWMVALVAAALGMVAVFAVLPPGAGRGSKPFLAIVFFATTAAVFLPLAVIPYQLELRERRTFRNRLRAAAPALTEGQAALIEESVRRRAVAVDAGGQGSDVVIETPVDFLAVEAQRRFIAAQVGDLPEESRQRTWDGAIARDTVRLAGPEDRTFSFDVTASAHGSLPLDDQSLERVRTLAVPIADFRLIGARKLGCGHLLLAFIARMMTGAGFIMLVAQAVMWLGGYEIYPILIAGGPLLILIGIAVEQWATRTDRPLRAVR